jgi:hypothetical protein
MDRRNCLLRFLCELEGSRQEAEKKNLPLDPDLEDDLILLKVAKYVVKIYYICEEMLDKPRYY